MRKSNFLTGLVASGVQRCGFEAFTTISRSYAPLKLALLVLGGMFATSTYADASALTSFWDGTTEHVFYVGKDYHVHELYYPGSCGSSGGWCPNDLTARTNAPLVRSIRPDTLTSFFENGFEHVFYVGDDADVHELYFNTHDSALGWRHNDLNSHHNAPKAFYDSALTGFWDGAIEHVFYVGDDFHVHELYYNGDWWPNDISARHNAPNANSVSALTSFFDGSIEHVFYIDRSGGVDELYYNGDWWPNPIGMTHNAEPVYSLVALTGFWDGAIEHVFYIGCSAVCSGFSSHVDELYYVNRQWNPNDLTRAHNAPAPNPNGLTSFFANGFEHVFYIGRDDHHVYELFHGNWSYNDLSGPNNPAEPSSDLTSFFANGFEHVFYTGSAGGDVHVHELYYPGSCGSSSGWCPNDLGGAPIH
jgi:hypothetical protein